MIAYLRGKLLSKNSDSVVLEAGGVGYEVNMCVISAENLPPVGEEAALHISESLSMYSGTMLYGFVSNDEKELFELFKTVPKTGAKKALDYLSKAQKSLPDFRNAIIKKDFKLLTGIFGFTKKTAEKLALALKDKVENLSISGSLKLNVAGMDTGKCAQVFDALTSLGFKNSQAKKAIDSIQNEDMTGEEKMEDVLKMALKNLAKS